MKSEPTAVADTSREQAAIDSDMANQRLESALEELRSVETIIERWTIDGVILDMNQYGLDLFGFSAEEMIGRPSTETFMPRQGDDRERLLANPGESVDSETECRKKDGTLLWVAWRNRPKVDENNNIVEILSIGIDITERRETEMQLERALTAMREQRRLTRILGDISAELTVQRDIDDLLDFILARISTFVIGTSVSVLMITEGVAEVVRTNRGDDALIGARLVVADTPNLREAAATRRPYVIADTQAPGSGWVLIDGNESTRTHMTVPIILGNDVIGFLGVDSAQPNAFPEELFEPLETFSNHVGVAIHNARMFAQSEAANAAEREGRVVAEAIADVSAALSGTLELDEVLDVILDRAKRVVPYSAGTVMLVSGDSAEVRRSRGYDDSMLGVRLPLTKLMRRMIGTSEPVVIEDTRTSPDWVVAEESKDIRSAIVVAIHSEGRVIGFISLDSTKPGSFTMDQARRLQVFADQAGNAIRNAQLYTESQEAHALGDRLLRAILPEQIATELKTEGSVRGRRYEDVAVLFTDIVGFTQYSDTHAPDMVLEALTEITGPFEDIARDHGLEKLKTIGDSFMAVSGLLAPVLNPDLQCVKAGLAMIEACEELASDWTVRIGVHSGELIAGLLGSEKFLFDVWGDTVNIASRMESTGVPGNVSVSRRSWDRIAHACRGHSRGMVPLKGKGEMEVFVVEGLLHSEGAGGR